MAPSTTIGDRILKAEGETRNSHESFSRITVEPKVEKDCETKSDRMLTRNLKTCEVFIVSGRPSGVDPLEHTA